MSSETSFDLKGELIWVEAVVVGPVAHAHVRLILDTGAAYTTLVPSVAEAIGYTAETRIRRTVTRTAAAIEYGYLINLVEFSALGVTAFEARANVANLGYDIHGVLGMSFLLDFNIEIRPLERRILVEKIAPSW